MKDLFNLLTRFSKSLDRDSFTKEIILEVIKKQTKVSLEKDKIKIQNSVLMIEAPPIVKNELRFKESSIKEELKAHKIFFQRILYK